MAPAIPHMNRTVLPGMTKKNNIKYSVVAPVYNESGNLLRLVQEVGSALSGLNSSFEFIAVDDGSTDGSDRILKDLCRQFSFLRVILFKKNRGHSAAFDAGI